MITQPEVQGAFTDLNAFFVLFCVFLFLGLKDEWKFLCWKELEEGD